MPLPVPCLETVKCGFAVKVAVAERSVVMGSGHVPVPEQAPDQPVKVEPEAAVAVSVTDAPSAKS